MGVDDRRGQTREVEIAVPGLGPRLVADLKKGGGDGLREGLDRALPLSVGQAQVLLQHGERPDPEALEPGGIARNVPEVNE